MLSDYNGIKLEISNTNIWKTATYLEIKLHTSNNSLVKKEIAKEIRRYFKIRAN